MSELETKVAEQLVKMNSEDADYDATLDKPGEEEISSTDDSQAVSTNDDSDDSSSDTVDTTDDTTDDSGTSVDDSAADTGGDESVVPDAYLRAAIHQGWKQEEVEDLWKTDSEKAEVLLKANLTATNNLSNQWSKLGQQQMGAAVSPAATATQADTQTTSVAESKTGFSGLDIAKLKDQYEDDDLIDNVVKPLNDLLIKVNSKLEVVESKQTQAVQSNSDANRAIAKEKGDAINQQIDTFFNSLKSDELKKFYGVGSDWSKFEGNQAENRIKLLEQADQIKAGAAYQDKALDNEAAMNLANLILSSHLAEQKIIGDIKKSLTKREGSLSLKPSGSRASSINDTNTDKSEKGIIKTIGAFMKQRKIKQY